MTIIRTIWLGTILYGIASLVSHIALAQDLSRRSFSEGGWEWQAHHYNSSPYNTNSHIDTLGRLNTYRLDEQGNYNWSTTNPSGFTYGSQNGAPFSEFRQPLQIQPAFPLCAYAWTC